MDAKSRLKSAKKRPLFDSNSTKNRLKWGLAFHTKLGGRFGYFSARGKGKWESVATGRGGVRICIENERKKGGLPRKGGTARGPGVSLGNLGGGGVDIFFGAEMSPKLMWWERTPRSGCPLEQFP